MKALFSICFSLSGVFCAVATQTPLQSVTAEVAVLMPLDKVKQDLEFKLQLAEINENDQAIESIKQQIYSQNLAIAQAKLNADSESLELQIESRNIALDSAKINAEIAMVESQANLARAFANKESSEVIDSLQIELGHREKLITSAQANIDNNNKIAELERRRLALSNEYTVEGLKQSREVERLREAKERANQQEKEAGKIAKSATKTAKDKLATTSKTSDVLREQKDLTSEIIKAMEQQDKIQQTIAEGEQLTLEIIRAKYDAQVKYLEAIKAIGDNAVSMFETTTNPDLVLDVLREQEQLQERINKAKMIGIQQEIKLNQHNLAIDQAREQSGFTRNEFEARQSVLKARQSILDAQKSGNKDSITTARQELSLANENLSVIAQEREYSQQLYNQRKQQLAIDSKSNLIQEAMAQRAGKFAQAQEKINSVAKVYNNLLDQQQKQMESIHSLNKSIYNARLNALTQESGLLDRALELKSAISNADENTPKSLVVEQTKQLKVLGGGDEKKLLMDRLKLEEKMAQEKMLALKAEQEMQKNLLLIELSKQKIQASMAVMQAQIMAMSLQGTPQEKNANGLVIDAVKNQVNVEQLAGNALASLDVQQMMEQYNQAMENFKNINQQRIGVATAGYTPQGDLPQLPKMYDVPRLKEQTYQQLDLDSRLSGDMTRFMDNSKSETSLTNIESAVNAILDRLGLEPQGTTNPAPSGNYPSMAGGTNSNLPTVPTVTNNNYGGVTVISSDPTGDARKVLNDLAKANKNRF